MAEDKNQQEIVEIINDFPAEEENHFDAAPDQFDERLSLLRKKARRNKKIIKTVAILLVILMAIISIFVIYSRSKNSAQNMPSKNNISLPISTTTDHVFVNDVAGVINNETIIADDYKGLAGRSENFHIKNIAIGGGTMLLAAETENLPIEISNVHTESLMSKDGKEMQLLISWKSNKLSRASVKYSNGRSNVDKTINEDGYGFSHALVMNKLELSTRYSFMVEASDREGNVAKSDTFVAYTGSKPVSIFDLISGEFNNMFGWAIR